MKILYEAVYYSQRECYGDIDGHADNLTTNRLQILTFWRLMSTIFVVQHR